MPIIGSWILVMRVFMGPFTPANRILMEAFRLRVLHQLGLFRDSICMKLKEQVE